MLVIMLLCALAAGVVTPLLYRIANGNAAVPAVVLFLGASLGLILVIRYMFKPKKKISRGSLAFFICYIAIVIVLTLFRESGSQNEIRLVPFASIIQTLKRGNSFELTHWLLNIMLFLPMGFLIPLIDRNRLAELDVSLVFGFCLSVCIESFQLIARMGTCDINDLIANTLGCLLGWLAYRFSAQKGWV